MQQFQSNQETIVGVQYLNNLFDENLIDPIYFKVYLLLLYLIMHRLQITNIKMEHPFIFIINLYIITQYVEMNNLYQLNMECNMSFVYKNLKLNQCFYILFQLFFK
ncbi:unnamed protein product [Paramecium pentaurelia]|uniref:Transmembrane protein n=1 Tax=Paramecium pentaurelia TaxID=43138 RepID=A0A8S1T7K9_9CILI|nr:unnamed protein product [Paramecium pentaurelia]